MQRERWSVVGIPGVSSRMRVFLVAGLSATDILFPSVCSASFVTANSADEKRLIFQKYKFISSQTSVETLVCAFIRQFSKGRKRFESTFDVAFLKDIRAV